MHINSAAVLAGPRHGVIQVARSLEPLEGTFAQLRLLAGLGLLLAIGFAALIVWVSTGTALRPLEHVIDATEAIDAFDRGLRDANARLEASPRA